MLFFYVAQHAMLFFYIAQHTMLFFYVAQHTKHAWGQEVAYAICSTPRDGWKAADGSAAVGLLWTVVQQA